MADDTPDDIGRGGLPAPGPATIEAIRIAYLETDETVDAVAERFGINRASLNNLRRRQGWPTRTEHRTRSGRPAVAPAPQGPGVPDRLLGPDEIEAIRVAYVETDEPLEGLAGRFDIRRSRIASLRRRFGWPTRDEKRTLSQKQIVRRLFGIVSQELRQLERSDMKRSATTKVRLLGDLVRTLDRLSTIDAAHKKGTAPKRPPRDMVRMRRELVERIANLRRE